VRRASQAVVIAALAAAAVGVHAQPPRVLLLDRAHHNYLGNGYQAFLQVVRDQRFALTGNMQPFTPATLASASLLVVVHAQGAPQSAPNTERAAHAFTIEEADAVRAWVEGGGALLLVTDHYPAGPAAARLAERFGVRLSGGWTDDFKYRRTGGAYGPIFGQIAFSAENGLLGEHAILRGGDEFERVRVVSSTAGDSLQGPPGSIPLLRLGPGALDWHLPLRQPDTVESDTRDFNPCPRCSTSSAAGKSQAVAIETGRGRVVVLAEMGYLLDYSTPGLDNRRFASNIVRWLARDL
jgi:hypothetical protein